MSLPSTKPGDTEEIPATYVQNGARQMLMTLQNEGGQLRECRLRGELE